MILLLMATATTQNVWAQDSSDATEEESCTHVWGDPTYAWGEDDDWNHVAHCTASRECSICHATESENGSITWLYYHNVNDRTCTEGSGNGYEATFTNEAFTTQTWCTGSGPLGHNWNIPNANWDYMPCSRHITCYRCDFERTVYATMTYDVITAPTCTMSGEYLYHATFDFPTDNLPYPDVNVESNYFQIPCLGHEYDTDPAWNWDRDYMTATAVFTCSRCAETADADASVTHVVQGEGTIHTAQVTFNDEDYSDEQYTKYYLILDEAATDNWQICDNYNIDNMGVVRDVLIQCTLHKDNTWQTLCLPFDVENIENSPLQGAVVKTIDKENTVMTDNNVHIVFTDPVTKIEAGIPYIVKWDYDGDLVNPRSDNVKYADMIKTSGYHILHLSELPWKDRLSALNRARQTEDDEYRLNISLDPHGMQKRYRAYHYLFSRVLPVYSRPDTAEHYMRKVMPTKITAGDYRVDWKTPEFDVRFYPEGGYLLEGQQCRVAWEAMNQQLERLNVRGVLLEDGEPIDSV